MQKKTIAVIFGGRSVEHDVSILTGLQFLEALNPSKYVGLPVYVDPLGQMWTGDALLKRSIYPVSKSGPSGLLPIRLDLSAATASDRPAFTYTKKSMLGTKEENLYFDLMVPAIHGSNGEDGSLQGMLEFAGIPFAGCRSLGAAATMNKAFAKTCARSSEIKVLPELQLNRPEKGTFLEETRIRDALDAAIPNWSFPLIVKPCNLGSSVGVNKADDMDALIGALMTAFRMDSEAVIEPFVANLREYNIAVRRDASGTLKTSAIERPLMEAELLDFKNKYLAGGAPGAPKLDTGPSEGMASLNRELNPDDLNAEQSDFIHTSASRIFDELSLAGSVRIDFLSNSQTGEIWLNEVNTIPGSFAYFLWEAASEPMSFLKLTDAIIEEGFSLSRNRLGKTDTAGGGASIFAAG